MNELQSKSFDHPDETLSLPNVTAHIVLLGEVYVGRYIYHPGWRWSKDIKPRVGTPWCQFHHQGVVVSGNLHIETADGARRSFGPNEVFNIPPGHDGWVDGGEPCVTFEFRGVRRWAQPADVGERVLGTLLMTDIVGSTALASKLGDSEWKSVLARHSDRVRTILDRFRGFEVAATGDGFLALFDGAARAVRCAAELCREAGQDGVAIRAGVHSGEVERHPDNIRGVAVHAASRIAALAGAGEVLVSNSTVGLLEGSGLRFEDGGEHELKGLSGRRRLFRLAGDEPAES